MHDPMRPPSARRSVGCLEIGFGAESGDLRIIYAESCVHQRNTHVASRSRLYNPLIITTLRSIQSSVPLRRRMRRAFSSASTKLGHRFKPLSTLPTDHTAVFRDAFFAPQKPVVFPHGLFRSIPATSRWFAGNDDGSVSRARLNYDYLDEYGDCHVPLELTRQDATPQPTEATVGDQSMDTFQRFHAPLSLFLDWTRAAQQSGLGDNSSNSNVHFMRLYLAQCQLLDLPARLRGDFPTPSIVATAGKGDVYDTNIWLGLAPTYTPLHRDPNPNLFVQLAGSKHVRLLPPETGLRTFARIRKQLGKEGGRQHAAYRGEDMMKGPERELLDQVVWGGDFDEDAANDGNECQDGYEAVLNAGDGLFIPLGWWHSIKGVGEGVTGSVSAYSMSMPLRWKLPHDLLNIEIYSTG